MVIGSSTWARPRPRVSKGIALIRIGEVQQLALRQGEDQATFVLEPGATLFPARCRLSRRLVSSAYPMAMILGFWSSSLKRRVVKRMKRTGDSGDPWGTLACTCWAGADVWISHLWWTESKALCRSSWKGEATQLLFQAVLTESLRILDPPQRLLPTCTS